MIDIIHKMIEGQDSYGNQYLIRPKDQAIFLILKEDNRPRIIGKIQLKDDKICYVKYEEESQRFKKTDA